MDTTKWAVVVEPTSIRAQKVRDLLKQHYGMVYCPGSHELDKALSFVDLNKDSIDVMVVGVGGHLEAMLDKHREYKLPAVVRVDSDSEIPAGVFTKVAHRVYRPAVMEGMPKDVIEYIDVAQKMVGTFGK